MCRVTKATFSGRKLTCTLILKFIKIHFKKIMKKNSLKNHFIVLTESLQGSSDRQSLWEIAAKHTKKWHRNHPSKKNNRKPTLQLLVCTGKHSTTELKLQLSSSSFGTCGWVDNILEPTKIIQVSSPSLTWRFFRKGLNVSNIFIINQWDRGYTS